MTQGILDKVGVNIVVNGKQVKKVYKGEEDKTEKYIHEHGKSYAYGFTTISFSGSDYEGVLDVTNCDVSRVTKLLYCFYNSKARVIKADGWNTTNVTALDSCFRQVSAEEISTKGWDTSNVTGFTYFCIQCPNLKRADFSTISNPKLSGSGNFLLLRSLPLCEWADIRSITLKNDKCTEYNYMIEHDPKLETLIIGTWDLIYVTKMTSLFYNTGMLKNIVVAEGFEGVKNIKFNNIGNFKSCPNLTRDSALVFINGLYDFAAEGNTDTHTISFHANTKSLLTEDDIAIATQKGWTIA